VLVYSELFCSEENFLMVLSLFIALIALIFLSGFFSCSETAMMSLNRYKLRHMARKKNHNAKRLQGLLSRTDKLLSVILLGNTFANILASSIATLLAQIYFDELGVFLVTLVLIIIILLFAEIIPKTYAAIYPEKFAYPMAWPLSFIFKFLYPIAWVLNMLANHFLKLFKINLSKAGHEALTGDELRSVVSESSSMISARHHQLLLGVLDLEEAVIEDVMIPRHRIKGLDLNLPWAVLLDQMIDSPYSKMPVYRDRLDNLIGILHLRRLVKLINQPGSGQKEIVFDSKILESLVEKPYFIPEMTSLQKQLFQFQENSEHFGLVVDEYGEIQGMVTLEDIVEDIVGAFSSNQILQGQKITHQTDGSYLLSGSMTIRDINRSLGVNLPTDLSKTLSGLITEYLQAMPTSKTCILINNYPIEILEVRGNAVRKAWLRSRLIKE